MGIKKKKPLVKIGPYCAICERNGWGMYCTGKCKKDKKDKGKK